MGREAHYSIGPRLNACRSVGQAFSRSVVGEGIVGNINLDDRLDERLARVMAERVVNEAAAIPELTDEEWDRLMALNETMRSAGKAE